MRGNLASRPLQQGRQRVQLAPAHVVELTAVHLPHRLVEGVDEPQSLLRDARGHDAAVVRPPRAPYPPTLLHPDQQPRDVRLTAGHHPVPHLA